MESTGHWRLGKAGDHCSLQNPIPPMALAIAPAPPCPIPSTLQGLRGETGKKTSPVLRGAAVGEWGPT